MINVGRAAVLVALCSWGCIFSMFHRSALSILLPELSLDLGLNSQQVGMLGALYLYAFALSQLPLGLWLAARGPRPVMRNLFLLAALGAFLLGLADRIELALAGRFLMGLGMSASFMGSLVFLAAWFSPKRFGFLSGLVAGSAALGGLLATTPLTWLAACWGWRGVFFILAGATAFLALLFSLLAPDPPQRPVAPKLKQSLRDLLGQVNFWIMGLASAARYGFFVALQSTWLAPFLLWGLGLPQEESARLILLMIVGYMAGMPLSGYISDRLGGRKAVIMAGLLGQALAAAAIFCLPPAPSFFQLGACLLVMGICSAPGVLIYAHARELIAGALLAPALTWINFFTLLAGGMLTQGIGMLLPREVEGINSPEVFAPLWCAGIGALCLAAAAYYFIRNSKREVLPKIRTGV
ncbi:MAG: MFS transporter [Desulfarculales bacterium]|jgi:nitrate/nitrite transporter NarK|nr:MFS transporter [Desulfarculales bacterium]